MKESTMQSDSCGAILWPYTDWHTPLANKEIL